MSPIFSRRFAELAAAFAEVPLQRSGYDDGYYAEGDWKRWASSAQSLVRAVYGEGSPHYQNFVDAYRACHGHAGSVLALRGVFLAAKDDFDHGYVFDVDLRVSGEVFGDFVVLAR